MHLLSRDPVAPVCLDGKSVPNDSWRDISTNNSSLDEVWAKLDVMQGKRCAYCESVFIEVNGLKRRHIEHFKPRNRFPGDTFNWANLFGSCPSDTSCGNYKDRKGAAPYDPNQLIKPDEDEPADYLIFSSDGSVTPKAGLSTEQHEKAQTTIAIFNLNGPLKQLRKTQLNSYAEEVQFYFQILPRQVTQKEWQSIYDAKLLEIDQLPFCSAVKQLFKL